MTRGPRQHVPFRRRSRGQTNYRKRLALLRSEKPRLVVRKTLSGTIIQFVRFHPSGDEVLASATTRELRKFDWKGHTGNVPAAYLTGYLAGRRATAAKVKEAVPDLGLHPPTRGSRVFAALQGVRDAGVVVPGDEAVVPDESRRRGEHLRAALSPSVDEVKAKLEAT
ncbi:MAG: 50S ribosomal protein L18 [Thermoplasmata archaeon]